MRTIGLLGGMSWESTQLYYQLINTQIRERLGGLHSAKVILYSVDFAEIEQLQHQGDWDATSVLLCDAAKSLELAGAGIILICTNTMHLVADDVKAAVNIPLLNITEVTGSAIKNMGYNSTLLLGTKFTMEADFYTQALQQHGLSVSIPRSAEREMLHQVIYTELCNGVVNNASKEKFVRCIEEFASQGVESVILGCTEIGLLVSEKDVSIPVFDTTVLHATAAVDFALTKN